MKLSRIMDPIHYLKHTKLFRLSVIATFFISGLLINVLQFLLYVFVLPFNRRLYVKLMYYPVSFLYGQVVFIYEYYADSTMKYYCDPDDFKKLSHERVFFIANHHYEIDWVITVVFCDKINTIGYTRSFIKKMLEYVPVIGWFWKMSDYISLERSYEKDKEVIPKQLTKICLSSDVLSILFFAEGTRRTEAKMEAARKYALEHNMEPYRYHLIPRTKGFRVCLPVLKKYCDSIVTFDICFEEDKSVISGSNLLQGKKFNCAGLMKRIPMSEVPEDPDEAAQFLLDLYREKDKAQECFLKHKNFSAISDLKPIEFKPKLWILINEIFWMVVSMTPIAVHLFNLLIQGYFYSFVVKLGVLNLVLHFFMQKSLSASDIHKTSDYGRQ